MLGARRGHQVWFAVPVRCLIGKTAIGGVADTMLASDRAIDQWQEPSAAELRARLSWPCRFQSDAELEAIGKEVFASKLSEIMAQAVTEASTGLWDASSEPA